jgi:hypothetical protein
VTIIDRVLGHYNEVRPHLPLQKDALIPRDTHKLDRVLSVRILGDYIVNIFEFEFQQGQG